MMILPDTIDADTSLHEKTPPKVRILMCMCSQIGIYKTVYMAKLTETWLHSRTWPDHYLILERSLLYLSGKLHAVEKLAVWPSEVRYCHTISPHLKFLDEV